MSAINNKLLEIIRLLETRPGFFFAEKEYSYQQLACFLNGYLMCLDDNNGGNYGNFSVWLNTKYRSTSLHWMGYIYHIRAKEDDSKAIKILFKELKAFVKSLDAPQASA